jgi:dTMP kinase
VLCDRFTDATFAYQGAGRGFDLALLSALESWVQEGQQPDITIWFDLPADLAARRRAAARDPDRFEREDERFFERVRRGYAARAEHAPDRFVRVDATGTREDVWRQIEQSMASRRWG